MKALAERNAQATGTPAQMRARHEPDLRRAHARAAGDGARAQGALRVARPRPRPDRRSPRCAWNCGPAGHPAQLIDAHRATGGRHAGLRAAVALAVPHGTASNHPRGRSVGGRHRLRLLRRSCVDHRVPPVRGQGADGYPPPRVRALRRRGARLRCRAVDRRRARPGRARPDRRDRDLDRRRLVGRATRASRALATCWS